MNAHLPGLRRIIPQADSSYLCYPRCLRHLTHRPLADPFSSSSPTFAHSASILAMLFGSSRDLSNPPRLVTHRGAVITTALTQSPSSTLGCVPQMKTLS
ncbi:hypothetical protein DFH07DRAFT_1065681 [Mycena maculata]|uniref:Uncharacterized protein n=1 Tax=Mycena maculata TaxID=230809 RepID=A0AAD7I158_9AGAR|nr:hypothetical protein DFH07DRAFT_1065681 [Mycena maculata]